MTWSRSLLAVLALAPACLLSNPVGAAGREGVADVPRPIFRGGVDVVALNVTVTDGRQQPLAGLARQDFAIFEDGVRQEITYFETSTVPLDLAILLDTSVSMNSKLPFVQKAASGFAATLRPGDRAAVLAFNGHVHVLQPFSEDIAAAQRAIASTTASGATALHNAVYVALREFQKSLTPGDAVRRRAIVVLTDGEDTASVFSFDELMTEARKAGVTIYTIGLRENTSADRATRAKYFSQADHAMRALAQETGASAFFPACERDLAAAYDAIGRELANQYAIGYVSTNPMRNGAFRRVVVRVAERPDARPRTRNGYVAASPGPPIMASSGNQ
jgi:Ca-activated chloride channel family protein